MGYRDLALAIVRQTVVDWKQKKACGEAYGHLTKWFKSEWCDMLLADLPITGEQIITALKRGTL